MKASDDDMISVVHPIARDGKISAVTDQVTRAELMRRLNGYSGLDYLRRDPSIRIVNLLDPDALMAWLPRHEVGELIRVGQSEGNDPMTIEDHLERLDTNQRREFLTQHGWKWTGAGWIAPNAIDHHEMDGRVFLLRDDSGGMFSLTTAVLEQLARDDPDNYNTPDEWGRYYREPSREGQSGGVN
jgi:hypothetical protein